MVTIKKTKVGNYKVTGGVKTHKPVTVATKKRAQSIANARKRVMHKRAKHARKKQ